jgi:predicted TIM-barrel fold metal-dependent hydrolase
MGPVTDFHVHAFPDNLAEHAIEELENLQDEGLKGAYLDGTTGDLIRSMDSAGIDRSVICSIATEPKQVPSILEWSQAVATSRIIPFGSLHPSMDGLDEAAAEMVECGMAGVKLHPQYQGFDLGDESTWRLFEAIEPRPLICSLHCGLDFAFPEDDERAHPEKVLSVHEQFPEIPLVAGHMGGWKRWESVVRHLAGTDIYMETSFTLGYVERAVLGEIINLHSIDRILLGSDSPWQDQRETLEKVRALFEYDAARKVVSTNAAKLLARVDYSL